VRRKGILEVSDPTKKGKVPDMTLQATSKRSSYEIYLERSGFPGNELDGWLQAERKLERVGCSKQSD